MRIISGIYRGRTIKAPSGRDTRPTTDRVRESIISSLISWTGGLDGAQVLDLFAGSGALGLECLSRGAASCTFCEISRQTFHVLASNIASLNIDGSAARTHCIDVFRSNIPKREHPYDVILLDPPYKTDAESVLELVASAIKHAIISEQAIIVYEYGSASIPHMNTAIEHHGFTVLSHKEYGTTCVDIISAAS